MHLWTEYEGRTIAGSYTLGKLLRSEGRNGFFATSDNAGNSAVIRLTESHFDEEEVLKRWRQVAELHQKNLIEIERVGQTKLDDVALTYALMERNDANLEDVLKERPLTTAETLEVAKSVLAAVKTLHASGLVHEHIEPVNVLAVGEVVKLRSDCVRECVADGEFTSEEACEELRKRDLHDFGTLLLRCLTLERELTPSARLAEPFNRVVPGAIEGTLNLAQLDAILNPPTFTTRQETSPAYASPAVSGSNGAAVAGGAVGAVGTPNPTRPPLVPNGVRPETATTAAAPVRQPRPAMAAEPSMRVRATQSEDAEDPRVSPFKSVWLLGGVAALAILFLLWHLLSGKPASTPVPTPPATVAAPRVAAPRVVTPPPATSSAATPAAPPVTERSAAPATVAHGAGWYVVAYTYNHENQARAKAARVSARRGFHAEVFSPSGRAPFLVSLGGPMNENEADAVLRRARRSGMPRDTFIRHY